MGTLKKIYGNFYEEEKSGAVLYSYDIHGNVKTLLQDNPTLPIWTLYDTSLIALKRYKRMDYEYDLISGKVNALHYQSGKPDAFHHKYEYDADNRITNVWTSKEGVIWDRDAKYFYYKHGPLARTELGDLKVQGIDYAYTLQGWTKGVNSESGAMSRDMGKDGLSGTVNGNFANDAFGYSLTYFENDYKPVGVTNSSSHFLADKTGSDLLNSRNDLFNGNISAMVTTLTNPDNGQALPNGMAYKYDQLNRISEARGFDNLDVLSNKWKMENNYNGRYYNKYTFDENGNILTTMVKNDKGQMIDNQDYRYQTVGGKKINNQLYAINDSASVTDDNDLLNQIIYNNEPSGINKVNNYGYSEIGELKFDKQDSIKEIKRRVDGKITEIIRDTGSRKKNIKYDYDAFGNRIGKHVFAGDNNWLESEYYVRDAQGNMLSVYKYGMDNQKQKASFRQTEKYIYGSSMLGIDHTEVELIGAVKDSATHYIRTLGNKYYTGNNHLGNDLMIFTDRKIAKDTDGDGKPDYYTADIKSARDYGIYGEFLTGRTFHSKIYPNSFNGKRDDEEMFSWQDYGFRNYIKAMRRFDRVDPLVSSYPWNSPYAFAENRSIDGVDLEGLEWQQRTDQDGNATQGESGGYDFVGFNKDGTAPEGSVPAAGYSFADRDGSNYLRVYGSNSENQSGTIDLYKPNASGVLELPHTNLNGTAGSQSGDFVAGNYAVYNIYNYETNDQYGTPENIAKFINIAVAYKEATGGLLNYGDLSNSQGQTFPPHASHANGSQIDYRYMINSPSGSATPVNYTNSTENLQRVQTFVDIAYGQGMRNFWLSNNLSGQIRHPETNAVITKPKNASSTTVNGVQFGFTGHENHGHTGR